MSTSSRVADTLTRCIQESLAPQPTPPPVEVERALLGAVLLAPDRALPEVRGLLESVREPFAVGQHREVWTAIVDLADAGKPIDPATVTEHLRAHGGPLAPSAAQVSALTDSAPTSCHAPAYARDVAAAARARDAERTAALLAGCLRSGDTTAAAALAARVVELTTGSADEGLQPSDILGAPDPPEPLFRNGPQPGVLALLLGDSGLGKTFAALGVAVSTSTGFAIWPSFKPSRKLRVGMVAAEDSREIIKQRILGICAAAHIGESVIREAFSEGRLSIFADADIPGPLFTTNEYGAVTPSATFEKLGSWCRKAKPDLLILDPFASVAEVPENDNRAVNTVSQELARLAARTGATLLLSHHTSKGARGGEAGQHSARGASALPARSKWTALLTREGQGLSLFIAKGSYGAPLPPVALERAPGGALLEVDPRRRMDRNAEELAAWLADNKAVTVTENGIEKNQRGGKTLLEALDWTPSHALAVLDRAKELRLVYNEERKPSGGGNPYKVLVGRKAQGMAEAADNDCPF